MISLLREYERFTSSDLLNFRKAIYSFNLLFADKYQCTPAGEVETQFTIYGKMLSIAFHAGKAVKLSCIGIEHFHILSGRGLEAIIGKRVYRIEIQGKDKVWNCDCS